MTAAPVHRTSLAPLAFVTAGALEYIPFGVLPDPSRPSTILASEHEVANLPSASALAAIRSETTGRKVAEKSVAVLADPVFELNDPRVLDALRKTARNNSIVTVRSGEAQATSFNDATSSVSNETPLTRSLRSFNLANDRVPHRRIKPAKRKRDH